jgi:hypothetical protein
MRFDTHVASEISRPPGVALSLNHQRVHACCSVNSPVILLHQIIRHPYRWIFRGTGSSSAGPAYQLPLARLAMIGQGSQGCENDTMLQLDVADATGRPYCLCNDGHV